MGGSRVYEYGPGLPRGHGSGEDFAVEEKILDNECLASCDNRLSLLHALLVHRPRTKPRLGIRFGAVPDRIRDSWGGSSVGGAVLVQSGVWFSHSSKRCSP